MAQLDHSGKGDLTPRNVRIAAWAFSSPQSSRRRRSRSTRCAARHSLSTATASSIIIGPKKALTLVRQHGRIENMPDEIRQALGDQEAIDEVRRIFLHPDVTDAFDVQPAEPDLDGIVRFLCDEREFSRERVTAAIDRTFRERSLW